ncbi:hypothetical protein B0J18DRAFT_427420 [Chaetomium sp. MPI-SDFR-AT-0129]|nr:hypothetical protein B0J18DRAFT_427420 [Chaetomium sp. MPI-SDFR-AT-0129]
MPQTHYHINTAPHTSQGANKHLAPHHPDHHPTTPTEIRASLSLNQSINQRLSDRPTQAMTTPLSRGYRSAAEYRFRPDQADAIVRATAYHRRDFGLSVIWFSPREHAGIRPSIATPFPRTLDTNTGLGTLGLLPLELLHDVVLRLDIRSLFHFRQANLSSRQIVDSLHHYQMVVSHGLNLLCALLRKRLAIGISLVDFYHTLCTKACTLCGEFGGFVSLLTWTRCCFPCLRGASEIQVQTLAATRKQLHFSRAQVRQLKVFETLPGIYTMEESEYKSRIAVVSAHQAQLVSAQQPHAAAAAQPQAQAQPASSTGRNRKFNFMGSCALPHYDKRTGRVENGMSCAGCQLALEKYIIGARCENWAFEARDKVYAQDSFLEHFRWCEQAQLLWKSSGEGTRRPAELPEAVRRRGFFNRRE